MTFVDLDELLDDTLPLPIGGRVFAVPSCDAELGLWCQRLMSAAAAINAGQKPLPVPPLKPLPGSDDPEIVADGAQVPADEALYRRLLGPAWDELQAAGVGWEKITVVAQTAIFWVASGRAAAEAFWNSGGNPEASAPNRRARRSSSTGGATTTRSPNSGSTTKSRKKPARS